MRRILLFGLLFVFTPSLFSATATPQELGDPLPNPADFVRSEGACRRKVNMSPWVGTPGVDWPNTFRCVLVIHTCEGVKRFTSGVRPAGAGMCDDYWRVHNELAQREICCDRGTREEKRPSEPPAKQECEPGTPWFGDAGGCKDMQSPQLGIRQGTASLSMCGYNVFSYKDANFSDPVFAEAYRQALRDQLRARSSSQVCCEKFREAV